MFKYQQMFKTKFNIPILYLLLLVFGFVFQILYPQLVNQLALYPRHIHYALGIITTVFLHANIEHLSANFLPLAACLFGLFYFYEGISKRVLYLSHILTGLLIWVFARPSFHIGASGLVYALVFFILISGIIRNNKRLMVIAFIILVFQSGLIWGIVPQNNQVSWESHLLGAVVGVVLSFLFRNKGPKDETHPQWQEDEDNVDDEYRKLMED
jgi:membrane associated rhomboid family serine protease